MIASSLPPTICGSILLLTIFGCAPNSDVSKDTFLENSRLRERIAAYEQQVSDLRQENETLSSAVSTLQELGDGRLNKLVQPTRIEITNLSGGRNTDDTLGDDAVTLYIQVFDQEDQKIKAAGEMTIYIHDFTDPEGPMLLCRRVLDVDQTRAQWFGRLLAYHFKVECPWQDVRPGGRVVSASVTFFDYLTGSTLQTRRDLNIEPQLPPSP